MRYLLLFAIFLLSHGLLSAQTIQPKTPGDLFIEAQDLNRQGLLLGLSSAGTIAATSILKANSQGLIIGDEVYITGYAIGAGLGTLSLICNIKKWNRVKQAGLMLNGNGLSYRF